MHLQPLYSHCQVVGGQVSELLFEQGLCLPSGTAMLEGDLDRIISIVRRCWEKR
jgi:dTDP-4-amino-4,6-dideoxygalactose transaminase